MRNWLMMMAVFAIMCFTGCANLAPQPHLPEPELVFFFEDIRIPMAAEAAPILAELGRAKSCSETPSCLFDGVDRTYCYGSFYLTTSATAQGEQVTGLWFADDTVETPEGISIGDDAAEILDAYGAQRDGAAYTLDQGNTRLQILTEEGVVTGVQYLALAG